jgi:hypothetical protein
MKFLLKAAFWLTVILILIPSDEKNNRNTSATAHQVNTTEAVSAASAAVSDMRQFCMRQPDACAIGSQAAIALGHKAQAGAKMLYEFLNEKLGPHGTDMHGASVPAPAAIGQTSQNALTPADLASPWRGSHPRKEIDYRPSI